MNQVQKGGVPPVIESYLDGEQVQIRPFLDQAFWREDWHQALTRYFQPGMHHYFWAEPGMGKTSVTVSLMQTLLNTELTPGRKWAFLTNQFFSFQDEEGDSKTSYPKGVHHYNSVKWMLTKIRELKGQGFDVAVIIDDMERFFVDRDRLKGKKTDPLSDAIRNLVKYRKKLGIMVWTVSDRDYGDFEDYSTRQCASDVMWCTDFDVRNQLAHSAKVRFPTRDYWYTCSVDDGNLIIPRTSWAYEHQEKKKGFFYDREGASVIRIGDGFDIAGMFNTFDQTPTVEIWDKVTKFLEAPAGKPAAKSSLDRDTEIAGKLKNIGLTDEAIEWVLSVPKTTLRRHVEKSGEVWGVSDRQPFLFRKVKASERAQVLADSKGETSETPS